MPRGFFCLYWRRVYAGSNLIFFYFLKQDKRFSRITPTV
jgi:hypothetical protein